MGSAASNTAIGTLVERVSGFVMLLHLPDGHGALAVQQALVDKMLTLDEQLRRSAFRNVSLSPDGRHLAAVVPVNGRYNLGIIDLETRTVKRPA